jgi:cytidylate kinase
MPVNGADQSTNREEGRGSREDVAAAGKAASRLVIAIDGPAASGKSTIGRALAHALGLLYLDTGAMYRAVTWLALQRGINPADEAAVTELAAGAAFVFPQLHHAEKVNPPIIVDGHDATGGIREPSVDAWVSVVASYPGVRAALVREQRKIARAQGVVMVGRDIGTVVLPDADLKIFLVASAEERARRRYEERLALGQEADYDEIRRAMERRDQLDTERAHSPLRAAPDAVALDTTGLTIDQVIDRALDLARVAAARATRS